MPMPEITDECLKGIRDYLLQDPEVERGCIVSTNMDIIPFENISPSPAAHILCSPEGVAEMGKLRRDNMLLGWAHSHPKWDPYPSVTDIACHKGYGCQMIIYSVPLDAFAIYKDKEIQVMRDALISGAIPDRPVDAWKSKVKQINEKKPLREV